MKAAVRIISFSILVVSIVAFVFLRNSEEVYADTRLSVAKQKMSEMRATDSAKFEAETELDVKAEAVAEAVAEKVVVEDLMEIEEIPVEPSCTGNVGGMYEEGDLFGIVSYNGIESALSVGMTAETLEGQAMLHSLSTPNHLVILGHCYNSGAVFGRLYSNSKEGMEVVVSDTNGTSVTYKVISREWVDEETYNTEEYYSDLVLEDESALVLVTCRKEKGVKGRIIVRCGLAQ